MQHIGIKKVDEKFSLIEGFSLNFADILQHLSERDGDLVFLNSIDPYGNTVFNSIQLVILQEELNELGNRYPETADAVALLNTFIKKFGVHQYLVFLGD